ncbi:MAG: hypothetical protein AAGH17_03910 [Pseudomonadota bacterium]
MAITLRIVGIFYLRADIPDQQTDGTEHTVKSVLDYAVRNPTGTSTNFAYINGKSTLEVPGAPTPIDSVTAFFSKYGPDDGPTSPTTQIKYPTGEYFLSESLVDDPGYRVWQYYVSTAPLESGKAVYLPRQPRIESYTTAKVPPGGSVTWRLCQILSGPKKAPVVYRKAFGLDGGATVGV